LVKKAGLSASNIREGSRRKQHPIVGKVFSDDGVEYIVTGVRYVNNVKTVFYRKHPDGKEVFEHEYRTFDKVGGNIVGDTYSYLTGDEFEGERHAVLLTDSGPRKAQFMGPGTNLIFRLQRGDQGLTMCDRVARRHDIDYALAGLATTKEDHEKLIRYADNRMLRKLDNIKTFGYDYSVNVQQGKLIMAKVALEDYNIIDKASFGGAFNRTYLKEDVALLMRERKAMQVAGF
jgi:hypothetical protein